MVAEVGFEPHGLQIMSLTSYQTALPRSLFMTPFNASSSASNALYHKANNSVALVADTSPLQTGSTS